MNYVQLNRAFCNGFNPFCPLANSTKIFCSKTCVQNFVEVDPKVSLLSRSHTHKQKFLLSLSWRILLAHPKIVNFVFYGLKNIFMFSDDDKRLCSYSTASLSKDK